MDEAIRAKLEARAWEQLLATAEDDSQWSFATETEGAVSFMYCPWSATEEWDFDHTIKVPDLPWSQERRELITRGVAEPSEEELAQWRRATCHWIARGTDWTWSAWVVPLRSGDRIDGYVAFVFSPSDDPDEPPVLQGIYESVEMARAGLAAEGAIGGSDAGVGELEELDEVDEE